MRRRLTLTPFDGLLLLMVLIWGANYSVVKSAIREIPPQELQRVYERIREVIGLLLDEEA